MVIEPEPMASIIVPIYLVNRILARLGGILGQFWGDGCRRAAEWRGRRRPAPKGRLGAAPILRKPGVVRFGERRSVVCSAERETGGRCRYSGAGGNNEGGGAGMSDLHPETRLPGNPDIANLMGFSAFRKSRRVDNTRKPVCAGAGFCRNRSSGGKEKGRCLLRQRPGVGAMAGVRGFRPCGPGCG